MDKSPENSKIFIDIFDKSNADIFEEINDITNLESSDKYNLFFNYAIKNDNLKNFKGLLNHVDKKGKSIIFYIIDKGITSLIDLLIDVVDLNIILRDSKEGKENLTLLKYIISERPSLLNYLLSKDYLKKFNLNPNRDINTNSKDPLIFAITLGNIEAVEILLKAGCSPNSLDENKNKAILVAANIGNYEIVDLLIASGAKVIDRRGKIKIKIKKIGLKALATLPKVASITATGLTHGANEGINLSAISDQFKRSHSLKRTKLYNRIYKRFLLGKWIKLQGDNLFDIKILEKYIHSVYNYFQTNERLLKEEADEVIESVSEQILEGNRFKSIFKKIRKYSKDSQKNILKGIEVFKQKSDYGLSGYKSFGTKIASIDRLLNKMNPLYLNQGKLKIYNDLKEEIEQYKSTSKLDSPDLKEKIIPILSKIRSSIKNFNEISKEDLKNSIVFKSYIVDIHHLVNEIDLLEIKLKRMYNDIYKINNYFGG